MVLLSRLLRLDLPIGQSALLLGPRQTGKSTLLTNQFPNSVRIDLLDASIAMHLMQAPSRLLEYVRGTRNFDPSIPVVVDEIQIVPPLLNEIHRLIESERLYFVMCGSSARKLVRGKANLLGGRAWRFQLHPLSYAEIPNFGLMTALNHGLLPRLYYSKNPRRSLAAYVNNYLKEEVISEGLTRNIPAFARFFEVLAFCHGELLNFSSIARDVGVDAKTVREYFQILVDTLVGTFVEPFTRRKSRNLIVRAPKFYLFDVGVAGYLSHRQMTEARGIEFGRAFEHFILMELQAYNSYRELDLPIRFWRTKTRLECDFVLGLDGETVVEAKGTQRVRNSDLRGLRAFIEENSPTNALLVCNEQFARTTSDGIRILPWRDFLDRLWGDELVR